MTDKAYRVAILISGSGTNMARILEARRELNCDFVGVYSSNPTAQGLDRANKFNVATASLNPGSVSSREEADQKLMDQLDAWGANFLVLAGYMRILSDRVIERFPGSIVNIHPSILPAFPGLHAQRQAIEAGVRIAGCTVHFVGTGAVDSGPIIAQRSVPVAFEDTEETLARRIQTVEHEVFPEALRRVFSGEVVLRDGRVARGDVELSKRHW